MRRLCKLFPAILLFFSIFSTISAKEELYPEGFPEDLKQLKLRESEVRTLAKGVTYYHYHFDNVLPEGMKTAKGRDKMPVSIYFVVIDWKKAKVGLNVGVAEDELQTVEEMTEKIRPLCAINGAYFKWKSSETGKPRTFYPLKVDGVVYDPDPGYDSNTAIGIPEDGSFPRIIKTDEYDQVKSAIGGYYIWKDGKCALDSNADAMTELAKGDTPLTAVGFNFEKEILVLMTSDGRFPTDAPGINFYGEGYFLSAMGCTDVISVDGGGSCTMLLRKGSRKLEGPMNHPSDNGKFDHNGARKVHNCIYVTDSKSKPPKARKKNKRKK